MTAVFRSCETISWTVCKSIVTISWAVCKKGKRKPYFVATRCFLAPNSNKLELQKHKAEKITAAGKAWNAKKLDHRSGKQSLSAQPARVGLYLIICLSVFCPGLYKMTQTISWSGILFHHLTVWIFSPWYSAHSFTSHYSIRWMTLKNSFPYLGSCTFQKCVCVYHITLPFSHWWVNYNIMYIFSSINISLINQSL